MSAEDSFQFPSETTDIQLRLLLFTDARLAHRHEIKRVQDYLDCLHEKIDFSLEIINIKDQPQLVELYRLVATPSLVKVFPEPLQVFAGSNILPDLERWWGQWLETIAELRQQASDRQKTEETNCDRLLAASQTEHSKEVMRLADEIFQLQREKDDLLKQIQFKDQILAMLAHDLRSPLTGTSLALETLEILDRRPPTEKTASLREQLHRQAKNQLQIMGRMITELLQESRQLLTKLDVKPQPLALAPLCQQIAEQIQERFQRKSIRLILDLPRDLPDVYGDRELVRQVIVNLLDNAMKYSPAGESVRLVGLHRTLQQVQISVIDTGHGIPEAEREKIFEGHFRLKRDATQEGYGLGLAVCRQIIQAHHGRIWVDSTPGQGSEFHFTLPVSGDRLNPS
ncbi:adaptive-response sensory-kinase sasA [[Synechococcus] sp. NIES-970]|nr:adaptive-response sensory-kinase sasA [[Synechococcus] sp. NIES-970]